jgi:hypothetical protein
MQTQSVGHRQDAAFCIGQHANLPLCNRPYASRSSAICSCCFPSSLNGWYHLQTPRTTHYNSNCGVDMNLDISPSGFIAIPLSLLLNEHNNDYGNQRYIRVEFQHSQHILLGFLKLVVFKYYIKIVLATKQTWYLITFQINNRQLPHWHKANEAFTQERKIPFWWVNIVLGTSFPGSLMYKQM